MMNIFFEAHKNNPREGPGNNESTARAYRMLTDLPANPKILDVGCGPGMQTLELARLSGGHITALDKRQSFLDELQKQTAQAGLSDKITTVQGSMFEMDFSDENFDLVWAEGSIYIIGFSDGMKSWKRFIKPGGYLAVTELSWLKDNPPQEPHDFWAEGYPAMSTVDGNLAAIRNCGYTEIGHFTLPEEAWWDNYYGPLGKRLQMLKEKYAGNSETLAALDGISAEIDLYRRYSEWYGYEFYIMQRPR